MGVSVGIGMASACDTLFSQVGHNPSTPRVWSETLIEHDLTLFSRPSAEGTSWGWGWFCSEPSSSCCSPVSPAGPWSSTLNPFCSCSIRNQRWPGQSAAPKGIFYHLVIFLQRCSKGGPQHGSVGVLMWCCTFPLKKKKNLHVSYNISRTVFASVMMSSLC